MKMYHGTSHDIWNEIAKEGVIWGVRNAPSRCTYLTPDRDEAEQYGPIIIEIDYDPTEGKNNWQEGAWQCREYEPIPLSKVTRMWIAVEPPQTTGGE